MSVYVPSYNTVLGLRRDMGAMFKKPPEAEDPRTGLTHTECRLLRQTWHYYCLENRDYGVLIFTSFFVKSPESLSLFPRFCNRPVGELSSDPEFRAHAFAVGIQLTSMVDNTQDPILLVKLIRKNAMEHAERRGVMPDHFRIMGETVIEVLHAMNEKRMNKAAILAWEKLFEHMHQITRKVYEDAKIQIKPVGPSESRRAALGTKFEATGNQTKAPSPQRSGAGAPSRSKSGVKAGSQSSTPKQSRSLAKRRPGSTPKAVMTSQVPSTAT